MTHFSDIFYPSEREKLISLTLTEKRDVTYPAVIVPHAGLLYVSDMLKAGFSHLRRSERYVFIAPLHNGAFPDSSECLFTLNDDTFSTPYGDVSVKKAEGIMAEDSIREEEYSLELTLPFFGQEGSVTVIPIFTTLKSADDVKKLRRVITRLNDGKTSFVISGNMASEGKSDKMKNQADTLEIFMSESRPLLEEARKGTVSGCAVYIAEAFRGVFTSYTSLLKGDNPMHRAGAFL